MAYLDTSVLGSFYCRETLSENVNVALRTLDRAAITEFVQVELASLLSLKVRNGAMFLSTARDAWQSFRRHRLGALYTMLPMRPEIYAIATRWIVQFNTPLRAADATHLAAAYFHSQPLWTTDKLLASSAALLHVPCRLITL